jgi:hypothetical protein
VAPAGAAGRRRSRAAAWTALAALLVAAAPPDPTGLEQRADVLSAREDLVFAEWRALEEHERDLAHRERQLDGREKRLAADGDARERERELARLETRLAEEERNLAARERTLLVAIEAADGRERSAAGRDTPEWREAHLAAKAERLDGMEARGRARTERLEAMERRLDARAERLDLLERRAAEPRPSPPRPPDGMFATVVKAPASLVTERDAAAPAPNPAAALHPGVVVEKAVAAASVLTFPSAASPMAELDREALDGIARLAARERLELLIWARAADASLMGEAQRRAEEVRARALAVAPLPAQQIVTRITTRPGARGVDVVVSALREPAPAASPVDGATASSPTAPAARLAPALAPGEAGKRQVREAVQAAEPFIEACVAERMERRRLTRTEGVLRISISATGEVAALSGTGDYAVASTSDCLRDAARAWSFPRAEAAYSADVPVAVIRRAQ